LRPTGEKREAGPTPNRPWNPKVGLYLAAGAGFAGRSAEWEILVDDVTATVSEDYGGIGLGAGLGYDI
jgi:hypothetical protein